MRAGISPRTVSTVLRPTLSTSPSCFHSSRRHKSTDNSAQSPTTTASLSPRWLSDLRQRIGKCLTFGLRQDQVREAGLILQEVARDWRELVAGSEGFLTGPRRVGLYRRRVIWGEQDAMGHVNNVLYNRYAETGRIEWAQKIARFIDPKNAQDWDGLMRPTDTGLILRAITTEFKFPMKFPDHITVYHKLGKEPKPGMDAFLFHVLILSELHQRPAARLIEDCVLYDYQKFKKTTLKPSMLSVLEETWRLQEEAKTVNIQRAHGLSDRVRNLELDSWDKEGAVEDMGSQKR